MAEFATKAGEAKLSAEVWRSITTMCTGKLPNSVYRLAACSDESVCFEFLLSAVKTGCCCVQYSLQETCKVKRETFLDTGTFVEFPCFFPQTSDQPSGTFHGRSIAFLTHVLQRLAAAYSHEKFMGHDHVLTTLLILMR